MNHRVILLLAAALQMTAFAQPKALNPAHLNEMPAVERVKREITAADPKDQAARQVGAFQHLNDIIEELSQGRTAIGTQTPDEDRLRQQYMTARFDVQGAALKQYGDDSLQMLRRFDEDPGLRLEILTKFFSPAFQARVLAVRRDLDAGMARMRQQNTAFGGAAIAQTQAAAATKAAPAKPAAPPAPTSPPDASIAKARAANVDTKVFGLQLGEPLSLPKCKLDLLSATKVTCIWEDDLADALLGLVGLGNGSLTTIRLAPDSCPSWLADCQAVAELDGGRLASVVLQPDGPKVDERVRTELQGKYGTRATRQQRFIRPDNGGAEFEVWDMDWELPGLHVEYKVVGATIFKGTLIIETERMWSQRKAKEKEANRPKL